MAPYPETHFVKIKSFTNIPPIAFVKILCVSAKKYQKMECFFLSHDKKTPTDTRQDALEMWRLMKGKTLFKNVESLIMEDFAQIQHENDVECWSVESSPVLAAV